MLEMQNKLDTATLDPDIKTGRPAWVSLEPMQTEFDEGEAERQSSNRKCAGGSWHIDRTEYMDATTTATDRHYINPNGGFVRDNDGEVADEIQPGSQKWNPGNHPDPNREIPDFIGPST